MKVPGHVRLHLLRLSLAALSLAATLTAAGELLTIGPAQPISIDRIGIAGTIPVGSPWTVVGNGDRFLLLWRDDRDVWPGPRSIGTLALRIDANGAALDQLPTFLPSWTDTVRDVRNMQLASNGEDYLLVWPTRIEGAFPHWELYGARLRADGTTIDSVAIRVALVVTITNAQELHVAVASDGRDYLVAWENYASRVTREGVALDRTWIALGPKQVVRTWWNGSAYVVQVRDGFLRIGANGTGGGPVGLTAAPVMNETDGLSSICDPAGCTAATVTQLTDGGTAPRSCVWMTMGPRSPCARRPWSTSCIRLAPTRFDRRLQEPPGIPSSSTAFSGRNRRTSVCND